MCFYCRSTPLSHSRVLNNEHKSYYRWPYYWFIYIRGHCLWLHLLLSISKPGQVFPPLAGFGLLHFRVFVIVPNPHVTLHVENRVHGPQLPSTKNKKVLSQNIWQRWCVADFWYINASSRERCFYSRWKLKNNMYIIDCALRLLS